MRISVGLPTYAGDRHRLPVERLFNYAQRAEALEFSGLWTIEHLVEPPTYSTSWYDPLTALSAVSGETETIPVGTSILNLAIRNPVLVAQRAATVHHLSGQRLSLGLGTGYLESEFEAASVPFEERSERFLEALELLRRLLTEDTVTYDGEYYSVEEFSLEPSLDRPPALFSAGEGVGDGDSRRVRKSVTERLDAADGWFAPPRPIEHLRSDWEDFAAHIESTGRNPDDVRRLGFQYLHLVPNVDRSVATKKQSRTYRAYLGGTSEDVAEKQNYRNAWLFGDVDDVTSHLDAYADAGFDEVMLHPACFEPSELDRQLRLWHNHILPLYG